MNINNAYEFFKNVKLTQDGYLIVSGSGGGGGTVEITINGNLYKIINAPNVENIRVIDQYDDEVGSIINDEVVVQIPQFVKPDVSINSVPYKEYESGAIDNILVKDQNDNEVGSLVSGEWIVTIPTFTDAEISINGVFYDAYSSGQTDNILIVDQNTNQIGSLDLNSGNWVVNLPTFTKTKTSINGVEFNELDSGETDNILVKDQNGNLIGSKVLDEWIVNLPTFTDVEVTINGNIYKTYSSGQTGNILIVDQNDNQIGSLDNVNDKWIVNLPTFTDVELSINNTPIDTYGSGESPNILVKDEDDNEVGSLIGGEWIVPSGSSGPTYVKSAMYTTNNLMYEIVDMYSDGSIRPNNMFDINSVIFDNNPRAYVVDINPNTGTLIIGGNFPMFSSYRTILRAAGGSNVLSSLNGTSFTGLLSSGYVTTSIYYDDINDVWFNVAQTGTNFPPPARVFKSIDDGLTWTIIADNPTATTKGLNSNNYQPLIGKVGSYYYFIHYYNNNITYIRYGTSMENAITTSSITSTYSSTDGTTIQSMAYGNGYYLITNNNILRRSTDGINFSNVSPNIMPIKTVFDDNNNKFVATFTDGIYTSVDGVTWTSVYAADYTNQINVSTSIHFNGVETIVGFGYVMLASTDLVNWYHKPGYPNVTQGARYRDLSNLLT